MQGICLVSAANLVSSTQLTVTPENLKQY